MNTLIETVKTPQDSVNDDSVIVTDIFVKNGQKISENEVLAEIETSKTVVDIVSESSGFVKLLCETQQEVAIGASLFEIYAEELSEEELDAVVVEDDKSSDSSAHSVEDETPLNLDTKFSKEALELIEKNSIDKKRFRNRQFVIAKDVKDVLNPEQVVSQTVKMTPQTQTVVSGDLENATALGKQKLNEIQYLSSVNASGLVSRLTVSVNGDLTGISEAQNFISSTPLPIIIHEVSRLLLKYPNLNSYFESNYQKFNSSINVGIALDNGINGLKVAGISNCDDKNLLEIEEEITDISLRYNENKLTIEDISSATFTITDLFSAGVTNFHPLINFNNSAILGVCGLKEHTFDLELSFDHRISNGLEVSKFLQDLKIRLESRIKITKQARKDSAFSQIECYKCLRPIQDDLDGKIYFIKVSNTKLDSHICSNCFNGF